VSGSQVQSAGRGPTSSLWDVTGCSPPERPHPAAPFVHMSFDRHWKNWAIVRRRAGEAGATACSAPALSGSVPRE